MTTNDESGNGNPDKGRSQRPHLTLDLTATEVTPEAAGHLEAPRGAPADGTIDGGPEMSSADAAVEEAYAASAPRGDVGIQSFVTHMAAGVLGALFALVIAYYVAGGLRDRLPMLTERSADDFRVRIAKQEERIAALDKAVHAPRPDAGQAEARVQALTDQANALKQDVAALSRRLDERLGAVVASTPAAPAPVVAPPPGVSPEAMQQNLEPLRAKLSELEGRLGQVAKAQSDVRTDGKASAVAVALYNLRRAANEGKPFAAELQTIAAMTPVPLDLAPLEAVRDKGVRTVAQLREVFAVAAEAAIEKESHPADESFAGRFWAATKSLIRVRRVGEVAGDTTEAILARAEVRLKAGDLRAAAKEAAQLKGDAAAALKPWQDEAQSRLAVDETLTRVEASLLAALSRDDSAKRGG